MTSRSYCPKCGAGLVSEPIGAPLHCKHCGWHLLTIAEWQQLSPLEQGYTYYMQASWPTSPLSSIENPHDEETDDWLKFREGVRRGVLDAQDSEE